MKNSILAFAILILGLPVMASAANPEAARDKHQKEVAAQEELTPQEVAQIKMVADRVDAPGFSLPDLDGKMVSLADFKGKWVILDFWGSWCKWCIAGIPEMKGIYEKYHGDGLEIIGIDCRESVENWKAGVEKYQLPWVNVYNSPDAPSTILADYQVPGFPTKVIVDPEGKVFDIVVGEDPVFYEIINAIFEE